MSKTIDEKVVEMRFDNSHFEKNTAQTMSTLEKLKQKLNLTGASKGLQNFNTAANKVNMSGMVSAIDTVHSKFSALEVMGITALANITNSAVNAGKRIVQALTVAPVMDGWNEYEMTLNAVQTTMAGTGKTAEEVEKQLKVLDVYADKTVYSTADMLNNLPKFTNAGVELEKATTAMIGIANATALAGGDASKASIAFYNLGQAIGTGYLTRMDYNSINNAGIATMEWKNQMVEAAIAAGTLKKVGDDAYQAGNRTMTLQQLFIDGLQEQWATTDVMMKVFGDYGDETTEIGKKSYAAAQDIKTFSQMMESLKATAGTGWKDTWQTIFGGLDEAKEFWTGLSNFISNIITSMADFRNKLLEGALGKSFKTLKNTLSTITAPMKKTVDTVKNATSALKDMSTMVSEVIKGDWGNGKDRLNALTKAGYNYYAVQNKVNETLGCAFRYSDDLVNSQKKLNKTQDEHAATQEELNKSEEEYIEQLVKKSDAELESLGYSKEQIEALKELKKYSDMTGLSIKEFIDNIDDIDGRWLLINAFKNAGQGLVALFTSIKDAWKETIGVINSDQLFKAIASFHKFSTYLRVSDDAAKNLKDTFKGVFAILDMFLTIIGGPIKIGLKLFGQLLKALDISAGGILELTGGIGRAITSFHDWLEEVLDFTAVFEFLAPYIKTAASAVKGWIKSLGQSEAVKKFTEYLKNSKEAIIDWFEGLRDTDNIAKYIFEGLINGLSNGIKGVIQFVIDLGKQILISIRKVLGIHSPSTEFFEIGQNIIQGLFNGISSLTEMIYNLVISVGSKIIEIVKNLDIGSIFTIVTGGGLIYAFTKIGKALTVMSAPFEGLGHLFYEAGETLEVFQGTLKSFSMKVKADALKSIAIAIGILAASVAVLALLDVGKVWSSVGAISVLIILLGALSAFIGKFGSENPLEFGKMALSILALGFAMGMMAKALKTVSDINPDRFWTTIGAFAAVTGAMLLLMKSMGDNGSDMIKLGSTFISMGVALMLMAATVKILGNMDETAMKQGMTAVGLIGALIVGLMAATKLIGKENTVDGIGKSISKIAGAILIMAVVVAILGKMKPETIVQGTVFVALFGGLIVGLMAATKLVGKNDISKIGSTILGISAAMLLMAFVVRIIGNMDAGALAKGTVVIAAFAGIMVGLMAATKLASGKDLAKVGTTILLVSLSIGMLALVASLLSLMDVGALAKGVVAVGFLSLMVMGLIAVTRNAQDIKGTMIAITVSIGILALALAGLSMIDPAKLLSASVALSVLMSMFALIVASTKFVQKATGTLIVLTVAIGVLAGAIYLVAQLPSEQALAASVSLSILLVSLAGVMTMISKMGSLNVKALAGLAGMAALILALYFVVDILQKMEGVTNASSNAMVLAGFLGVLAIVQILCAAAGAIYAATGGIAALGLLGMIAIISSLYILMGVLAVMSNINNAITNLNALQGFLSVMTEMLVKLAIVGPFALVGVAAMTGLTLLMGAIGVFATYIGALMQKYPALQSFLDTGLPVLVQLTGAIGQMIGAFVSGILTQISAGLPEIGMNLSLFMSNLMPFITGAKLIDNTVLKGIGIIAAAIFALTAAQLMEGITSFLTGGTSFADLGTQLSLFMMNALPFILLSKQIDPNIMTGVKTLADAIMVLTGANILEGMTSWLTGGNSLATFGAQLGDLGNNLKTFVSNLGTFSEEQVTTVKSACSAIRTLAEAAKTLPNEGGLWASLAGDNSLATFGDQLPGLATNLNKFVTNLGTFSEEQVTTVKSACSAIKTLAAAAESIPNEGGLWGAIVGDNSLATFAGHLPGLGSNLSGFVTNLGTFKDEQINTVNCACDAIKTLASVAETIPNEGGLWSWIAGDNSLTEFAGHLPGLGTSLKNFVGNLGTFTDAQVTTVSAACLAIRSIAQLGDIDVKDTGKGLKSFGDNVVKFAKKVKEFISVIAESSSESITAAINKTKELIDMARSMADVNVDSLKTFGNSLKSFAKNGVTGFVDEFSGENPRSRAKKAVTAMVQAGIDGAEEKKDDVETKFGEIADKAISGLSDEKTINSAKQAGIDLIQGLINGLSSSDKRQEVWNAAYSLGQLAVRAEKEGQESNSPSKATERAGKWLGEGLIIGINKMTNKVYGAGRSMGEEATNSISGALDTALRLINTDMDTEPTIRPVLDLSDVESGVGYLSGMLNGSPSLAVASNLGAISFGMNTRNQNGTNDDVVSAIDELRKDLGNVGGNTYNVNGITYDDGSNITEAVKAIVRAATVGRRT